MSNTMALVDWSNNLNCSRICNENEYAEWIANTTVIHCDCLRGLSALPQMDALNYLIVGIAIIILAVIFFIFSFMEKRSKKKGGKYE